MKNIDLFTFKKLSGVLIENTTPPKFKPKNTIQVASELETVMHKGFRYDESVLYHLLTLTPKEYQTTVNSYHSCMNALRGGNLSFKVLRKSFPDNPFSQVTDEESFHQLIQYFFYGCDVGGFTDTHKVTKYDVDKLQLIRGVAWNEVVDKFTNILESKDSISDEDGIMVVGLLNEYPSLRVVALDSSIQHKEIMGMVVSELIKHDDVDKFSVIKRHVKTITDVLRIAVAMSGADTSMSEKIKFKKFTRKERKFLCGAIKYVYKTQTEFNFNEDLLRNKGLWLTLSKAIHVGDYGLHGVFDKLRNDAKGIPTFNSIVQNGDVQSVIKSLSTRATEFTRNLSMVLTKFPDDTDFILDEYEKISSESSLNSLFSAYYHFSNIDRNRVIMPKTKYSQKILSLPKSKVHANIASKCSDIIDVAINENISSKEMMDGEYYIEPSLYNFKLPTQQRNASDGLLSVARGTRVPLTMDENYIRLFTHWIGDDIDMSFALLDENLNGVDSVNFGKMTHKINNKVVISHSGDFTYAPSPRGASEFIDIRVDAFDDLVSHGLRYGVMYINVYYGCNFDAMEHCVSGWTTRNEKDTNLYVPSDVKHMFKIDTKSKSCIPMIIDFKLKEIIWSDMTVTDGGYTHTVWDLMNSNIQALDFVVNNSRMSVGELLERHITARGGVLVDIPSVNTIHYNEDYGYDVNSINSELL